MSYKVTVHIDGLGSGSTDVSIGDTVEFKDADGRVVARLDLYEPEGYKLVRREGKEEAFIEVDSNR